MATPVHPHVQRLRPGEPFWVRWEDPAARRGPVARLRRRLRPLRRVLRRGRHGVGLRLRYPALRGRTRRRLFVVAEGRTGSTLLLDYLRSVPGTSVTGEILHLKSPIGLPRGATKPRVLRHLRLSMAGPAPIRVAKLDPWQMEVHGLTLEEVAEALPDARFVLLYRRDLARAYVSWCTMQITGRDKLRPGEPRFEDRLTLDPDHFQAFCRQVRRRYDRLRGSPSLTGRGTVVAYEALAEDPQIVFERRIAPLLGVPPVRLETRMRRQSTRPVEERIANLEEMRGLLEGPDRWLHVPDLGS